MVDDAAAGEGATPVERGMVVYDHEGHEVGVVTEMTSVGFEAATAIDIEGVSDEGRVDLDDVDTEGRVADAVEDEIESSEQAHDPGQEFGEGYLMWRCDNCGEMGDLDDGLPNECPHCGAENVYKWRED